MRRILGILVVLAACVGLWLQLSSAAPVPAHRLGPPTARVVVAPIQRGPVVNHLVAYGRVVPAPWAVHALVEPFEVSVRRVLVNRGQSVGRGAALLQLAPAPAAESALWQAQNTFRLARLALQEARARLRLQLATRSQLLQAQKAFMAARLSLQVFRKEGLRRRMVVRAPVGGVVNRILVQEGAAVPAGQPLMDVIAGNRLEVRLGVEPEDVPLIRLGERVRLTSFEGAGQERVHGLVAVIARVMDPVTHMINVFVTLPAHNAYLLGEYVQGRFTTVSGPGLLVPRQAVLPVGHHFVLYTVAHGRAVAHTVTLGAHNGRVGQVLGPHLRPGMRAVVQGNFELKPGMPVRVRP